VSSYREAIRICNRQVVNWDADAFDMSKRTAAKRYSNQQMCCSNQQNATGSSKNLSRTATHIIVEILLEINFSGYWGHKDSENGGD
jgi:hypothetical protein